MWAEGNGVEGKPQVKVMFQASKTGKRVEPFTEAVTSQVSVLIRQLDLKCQGHPRRKLQVATEEGKGR